MRVKDLIRQLKEYDENAEVIIANPTNGRVYDMASVSDDDNPDEVEKTCTIFFYNS